MISLLDMSFYKGKKVFITGHTGFKGSWLCKILLNAGAVVTGYSLAPQTTPNLYDLCHFPEQLHSIIGDIRELDNLMVHFLNAKPEIVFHLAAQPLVRDSYDNPVYTYETNVMGTVNLLECVRQTSSVKSVVNVTTDKVYFNHEWDWGYRENELLNGFDPYSNSKSCSELVTSSYINSFFSERKLSVSTARAGNVIGGGDFASNRIIPDCVRAASKGEPIVVRNPNSTRPYQHVLDPLYAYLMIAKEQFLDTSIAGCYNVGPEDSDCVTTGRLVDLFIDYWRDDATWINVNDGGPHEANFLKLDCSKLKNRFHWKPTWDVERAIQKTVEWSKIYMTNGDVSKCMDLQIDEFFNRNH